MQSFQQFITESYSRQFWIIDGIVIPVDNHVEYLEKIFSAEQRKRLETYTNIYDKAIADGYIRVSYSAGSRNLFADVQTPKQVDDIVRAYPRMGIRRVDRAYLSVGGILLKLS